MIPFLRRNACPICRAENGQTPIYERAYRDEPLASYLISRYPALPMEFLSGRTFTIMRCGRCTGMYHLEVIEDFYDNPEYKQWDGNLYKKKAVKRALYYQSFQNNFIVALLLILTAMRGEPVIPSDLSILDYGCGAGEFLFFAKAYGLDATGYDADPLKQDILAERGVSYVNEESMATVGRTYDIINSNMVFEHLLAPYEALGLLAKALTPGGLIRISVPSWKNIEKKIHIDANWSTKVKGTPDALTPILPFGHRNCFTPESIDYLAREHGLRVIDPETFPDFQARFDWFPLKPIIRLDGQFYLSTGD